MADQAKTWITYQGGSGGDMFAASANGILLDFDNHTFVPRPGFSIKHLEADIASGAGRLLDALNSNPHAFVTTHFYEPLRDLDVPVIEIGFQDAATVELVILRQMRLQTLRLDLDPSQTFVRLLQHISHRHDWHEAARLWFDMARQQWQDEQRHRKQNPLPNRRLLLFDRLFCNDFVDSLCEQGFEHNLDQLRHNHGFWLSRNLDHDRDQTLQAMAVKIADMELWLT